MASTPLNTWDIFCRVVDNYGDIGVCWRLARQLANEYPFQVRLWVDEIEALTRIWPSAHNVDKQIVEHVEVCSWRDTFDRTDVADVADVVIEAFACELPNSYLSAMKHRSFAPHWFNLEYLSAEDWVDGCHGLFSMHPQLGLKKAFFFPGFTLKTGGLLKEARLLDERDKFQSSNHQKQDFLRGLGVDKFEDELLVSLFGYENDAIASLLESWIHSPSAVLCLVPASKTLPDINNHLHQNLAVGDEYRKGSLRLKIIPFLNQIHYDQLLWACDLNFVRGEDSFVRAQWAGKPLIWHIYPQDDDIHMIKLNAFLKHYLADTPTNLHSAITGFWHNWNTGANCSQSWNNCMAQLPTWQKHSSSWCHRLNSLGDLASNMVHFCQKTL